MPRKGRRIGFHPGRRMTRTEPIARRGQLPLGGGAYRTIGPFGAESLPKGLRAEHRLREDAWAVLGLSQGSLRFVWDDDEGGAEVLTAPAELVVPPTVPHHVEGEGPFTLTITFYRG